MNIVEDYKYLGMYTDTRLDRTKALKDKKVQSHLYFLRKIAAQPRATAATQPRVSAHTLNRTCQFVGGISICPYPFIFVSNKKLGYSVCKSATSLGFYRKGSQRHSLSSE